MVELVLYVLLMTGQVVTVEPQSAPSCAHAVAAALSKPGAVSAVCVETRAT